MIIYDKYATYNIEEINYLYVDLNLRSMDMIEKIDKSKIEWFVQGRMSLADVSVFKFKDFHYSPLCTGYDYYPLYTMAHILGIDDPEDYARYEHKLDKSAKKYLTFVKQNPIYENLIAIGFDDNNPCTNTDVLIVAKTIRDYKDIKRHLNIISHFDLKRLMDNVDSKSELGTAYIDEVIDNQEQYEAPGDANIFDIFWIFISYCLLPEQRQYLKTL